MLRYIPYLRGIGLSGMGIFKERSFKLPYEGSIVTLNSLKP